MARKIVTYTVTDEGRDQGKVFQLTEMPASQGEAWGIRALLALMNSGVNIPEGFENAGMAGIAEVGVTALGKLQWQVAEPLFAEMWECVKFIPDPSNPKRIVRDLIEQDIEEIQTRLKLRWEVLNMHVDFSKAVATLNSPKALATAKPNDTPNT